MVKIKKLTKTQGKQDTTMIIASLEERRNEIEIVEKAINALCPTLRLDNRIEAETLLKLIATYYKGGTMHYNGKKVQSYYCSFETWVIKSAYYPDTKVKYWYIQYDDGLIDVNL